MTDTGKAVFLSYASQDAEAAQQLCNALRAGGIEVWFDQSELRGGDAWDSSIRRQIKACALLSRSSRDIRTHVMKGILARVEAGSRPQSPDGGGTARFSCRSSSTIRRTRTRRCRTGFATCSGRVCRAAGTPRRWSKRVRRLLSLNPAVPAATSDASAAPFTSPTVAASPRFVAPR